MPSSLPDQVRMALNSGQKIEAIRLLREQTGLGLAEAKKAVESGFVPDTATPSDMTHGLPSDVAAALAEGNKIEAIKLLRQTRGLTLKQAKAMAEEAQRNANRDIPARWSGLSPGEVPRKSMSASLIISLIIVVALVAWLYFDKSWQ